MGKWLWPRGKKRFEKVGRRDYTVYIRYRLLILHKESPVVENYVSEICGVLNFVVEFVEYFVSL